jgi:xylose isomerase
MNKLAVISAFLGGVKNRYIQYHPDRPIRKIIESAGRIDGIDGLELCFPSDFENVGDLKKALGDSGLGVSAINVRSRRQGRWLRGSFSSAVAAERREVVDEFKMAMDLAREVGTDRITTCPLNDGHDYVFEMNYFDAYRYAEESFAAICAHNREVKICIEYKKNDPRTRCLLGSAGETVSFCQSAGAPNLGLTLDFGHALLSGERPAQSLALAHRAGRLFYVHLNDNDRTWDWDMLPGAFHLLEFVEFHHYLKLAGYENDWFSYDVFAKEVDLEDHFRLVAKLTRKIETLTARLDADEIRRLLNERNPSRSLEYIYDQVFN